MQTRARFAPLLAIAMIVSVPTGSALAQPPAGKLEQIRVHGAALDGNLSGDDSTRDVFVYLPPSYARDKSRRYPVVYFLHGYTATAAAYVKFLDLPQAADAAIGNGVQEMIVVLPDAFTKWSGSMYSSSVTTGDWETFVAQDLVSYIDGHYRTLAVRISRGLAGHSMGGYGALRIAMKRPDVFSSLYVMSACCLAANANPRPESFAASEAIKTRAQAEEAAKAPGFGPSTNLASAAAWSPNPNNPPLFLDLPVKDGKVRPEIADGWIANAPMTMLEQNVATLQKFYAIAIDIGTADTLLASNRRLHEKMTELRIPHFYEEYDGDHTNKVGERLERSVLPFFSKSLASPANPTSPAVQ